MSFYNFKKIQVVPTAMDFTDIVLSKTQRKTPTVVHPNYQIARIRQFYMRKVRFAQDEFDERLGHILTDFPKLDEIHPFYADLLNILYDRDHYKLALGQINTARHLIDQVAKDYVRLLKFGDSLYRCKQLKRAALGRMATIMKRQKDALAYLEQVRMHLARLPSIDPNTRTLLICGYPNVGKSSFMNKVTRAEVDVQPYAFTTKSLFVGHMDYKYLRWQCIDTPGILDHPLESRNTIEMQSITALAHLRACILFFLDLSEQCGYTIAEQVALFHSIKPLFSNKPTILVINKIDQMTPEQLDDKSAKLLKEIVDDGVQCVRMSCYTDEGVMNVRNTACDILLQTRVEAKMKGTKVQDVMNKLHLALPQPRDEKERKACIPEGIAQRVKYDRADPNRARLERDIETENGGAGVYNVDLKKLYKLDDAEWKYDKVPEIMDGKNVADFVDPEIEKKLLDLEQEEEKLVADGFYESDAEEWDETNEAFKEAVVEIREKRKIIVAAHRAAKNRNHPAIPTKFLRRSTGDMEEGLEDMGMDRESARVRAKSLSRPPPLKRKRDEEGRGRSTGMEVDGEDRGESRVRGKSAMRDRSVMGMSTKKQKMDAVKIQRFAQTIPNLLAKRGEADRAIREKRPKHLFSGKRGSGKTDRR